MCKLIDLNIDSDVRVSSRVNNFLNPDYVYYPISISSSVYKKNMENVLRGEKILDDKYSSVSGMVTGGKIINGENYIIVSNDFKEKNKNRVVNNSKKISSAEEFELLCDKFEIDSALVSKNFLVLNIIENEPFILNNVTNFKNQISDYLELLDFLKSLYKFEGVIILTKNTETSLLNVLNNKIGTYPDFLIVTVPNYYLIHKSVFYKKYLPCDEVDACTIDFEYLKQLYYALYKNSPVVEKTITITGDAIKNPMIVNVKIGTRLSDVIDELIEYKSGSSSDIVYYINSIINKKNCVPNQVVVDNSINGVFITYDHLVLPSRCIKCGLCLKYCPLGLNPIEKMNKDSYLNCDDCQICSFVCPSHVGFKYGKEEDNNEF